jgi:CO dehydrogenase/acetyl-CoA synthase beta subunit
MPERNEQNQEGYVRMADIVTKVAAGHLQTTTMHEFFVLPYSLRHCFISVTYALNRGDEVLWT